MAANTHGQNTRLLIGSLFDRCNTLLGTQRCCSDPGALSISPVILGIIVINWLDNKQRLPYNLQEICSGVILTRLWWSTREVSILSTTFQMHYDDFCPAFVLSYNRFVFNCTWIWTKHAIIIHRQRWGNWSFIELWYNNALVCFVILPLICGLLYNIHTHWILPLYSEPRVKFSIGSSNKLAIDCWDRVWIDWSG